MVPAGAVYGFCATVWLAVVFAVGDTLFKAHLIRNMVSAVLALHMVQATASTQDFLPRNNHASAILHQWYNQSMFRISFRIHPNNCTKHHQTAHNIPFQGRYIFSLLAYVLIQESTRRRNSPLAGLCVVFIHSTIPLIAHVHFCILRNPIFFQVAGHHSNVQ